VPGLPPAAPKPHPPLLPLHRKGGLVLWLSRRVLGAVLQPHETAPDAFWSTPAPSPPPAFIDGPEGVFLGFLAFGKGAIRQVWGGFEAKPVFWGLCGGGHLTVPRVRGCRRRTTESHVEPGANPPRTDKRPRLGGLPPF
jgi:hypothetical protein